MMLARLLEEKKVHVDPRVWFYGDDSEFSIGDGTSICGPSELNAKGARIEIGEGCDIAAFVSIHCSDSHLRCLGKSEEIERLPIKIGNRVFIGQGAIILGGAEIGDDCVIGAGAVVIKRAKIPSGYSVIPAVSLVVPPSFRPSGKRK